VDDNPARSFDKRAVPEARPRIRYLTRQEYDRLMQSAAPHLCPIIEIAVQTGMRSEELLSLTWDQVSLDRREITLTRTKSSLPRVIPLSDAAVTVFVAMDRHVTSRHVFCDMSTGARYGSVKKAFRAACRRAKIENFRFHDLRHTFASWAVQGGMDLYRLSRILGHATTQMTARYAHLATADLHDAIQKVATNTATSAEENAATGLARSR
jgi:integrase